MKPKNFYFLLLALFSLKANAQILDQSQLNYNGGTSARTLPGYSHFQSFTAGISGTLVQIDMGVFNAINGSGTLKIYAGSDTTGTLLQSTQVTVFCASGNCFANFTVSVDVTAGQVYSFRFIPGAGIPDPYGIQIESPGTYAGGQMAIIDPSGVYYTGFDQVFKTYVATSVGIATLENQHSGLTIFPNPLSTSATIEWSELLKSGELSICSLSGQKMQSILNITGNSLKISRGNLSAGVYNINLTQDNKLIATSRLVITE